jgi:hypothetical protein
MTSTTIRVSKCLRSVLLLAAALCLSTSTTMAERLIAVSGTSASGRAVTFSAGFTFTGDELWLALSNLSPESSWAAADVLTSFYFDISRGADRPSLVLEEAGGFLFQVRNGLLDEPKFYTPQTYVNVAGQVSDLVARDPGDGAWLFRAMAPEQPPFLGFGIGTVGNSGLSPNSFDPHIVGPPGKNMIDFGIFAGIDIDPVGVLNGSHLIHQEILFRFSGAAGYGESDVVDLFTFGMGTGPDSTLTISMPEPSGFAMTVAAIFGGRACICFRRTRKSRCEDLNPLTPPRGRAFSRPLGLWRTAMNSTKVLSVTASCGVFLVAALAVVTVHAATIVPPATGWGVSVPPGGLDSNWEVAALPTLFAGASTPYPAFVFAGTGPGTVPSNWLGGANNAGVAGAHWIGMRNAAESLFSGGPVNPGGTPPQANYNMIYRYTFTQSVAGPADFAFWAAADNKLTFYLNGTITADAMSPSIVGGTQIGTVADGFGRLHSFTGTGSVITGTNHLYAVVTDKWNDDGIVGTWGYTGLMVSRVPEPASFLLAAQVGVAIGAVRLRQRAKPQR